MPDAAPPPQQPNKKSTARKSAPKKAASKKSAATKKSAKKSPTPTKKTSAKKTSAKKTSTNDSKKKSANSSTQDNLGDEIGAPTEGEAERTSASSSGPFGGFEGFGSDTNPWGMPFNFGSQPPELPDVGEFIRNQRELAKLSVRRLAELANVSNPYLSQVERGLRKPSADILQQLATALRISVESLYVKAGILPDDAQPSVSSVPEAIEHDPYLTADQKVALRGVYDSFVSASD